MKALSPLYGESIKNVIVGCDSAVSLYFTDAQTGQGEMTSISSAEGLL